jgi:hypothetical protein
MSEYQYYDFRAIDRPLTSSQRAELGKISTRAEISSTSFTNFYTFGDFKGNPVALVERTTGRLSRFTRFVDELRQRHRAKVSLLKKLDGAMGPGAASASTT